jgi:hypothetical protein
MMARVFGLNLPRRVRGIHVEVARANIDQDRLRAGESDRAGGADEGHVGDQDGMAGADAQCFQCQGEGEGAAGGGDGVGDAEVAGQLGFEGAVGFALVDEPAHDGLADRLHVLGVELRLVPRDGHVARGEDGGGAGVGFHEDMD